jgi:hypothetical protein
MQVRQADIYTDNLSLPLAKGAGGIEIVYYEFKINLPNPFYKGDC